MTDQQADQFVHAIVDDWKTAGLSDADLALCEFSSKLTKEQFKMMPEDLEHLRGHGFNDRAIHDTCQVVGYFNYITRIADGLGIDPEEGIQSWGSAKPGT